VTGLDLVQTLRAAADLVEDYERRLVALETRAVSTPEGQRAVSHPDSDRRVWFDTRQAAERCGVHRETLLVALQTGDLRGTQRVKGGRWRLHLDDLDAWLREAAG
jgi:excisionase family DNA binding protein